MSLVCGLVAAFKGCCSPDLDDAAALVVITDFEHSCFTLYECPAVNCLTCKSSKMKMRWFGVF